MAKLLTVEDETAIRELLAFICETDGHEVVKAASLAEAREALRRGGLDLILLDVMLLTARGSTSCAKSAPTPPAPRCPS